MLKDLERGILLVCMLVFFSTFLAGEETVSRGHFRYSYENSGFFFFTPISDSYLYLFAFAANEEFLLVFPLSFSQFLQENYYYNPLEFGADTLRPFPDSRCFRVQALVSTHRLKDFEQLVLAYRKAAGAEKRAVYNDLLMCLESLKSLCYSSTAPETPWKTVSIPGEDKTPLGRRVEVTAVEFNYYFKIMLWYECE